jgi:hypothetical protein
MVLTKVLQAAIDAQNAANSAAEEVRDILIPLSRQYMTLAAAQADIANIPEGSTTYYRSPDDSALAIEVMNVGGTLTETGRKMPSQASVNDVNNHLNEEIKQRKQLIDSNVQPGVLSILDDNGYEGGRITMSSLELQKFKILYSALGPILALQDSNGYGSQIMTPDGKLMAGMTKFFDGPGLLSLFGQNGFGTVLLDENGALCVGSNRLFEVKGYTFAAFDSNGWVIWGITDEGYTVSRNGSGNVEPVPSVLESNSVGHWLFGREATSYGSRVGTKALVPQATPSFNGNYITTLPWGGALVSDIPDAGEYTVCAVVRVPAQSPETDCVVVYGTQNGYSLRDDDDTYTGNQLSLFSDRDTRRWIRSKISGYRGTSRQYPTMQPPVSEWIFVSHVVRLTGTGKRYQAIVVGDGYFQELREADTDRLILSGRNVAVGNAYCDVAAFKTKGLDIAEFIYFDHALSAEDVRNVYINSRIRMAERSIDLN